MATVYTKKDDITLVATKQIEVKEEVHEYSIEFLKQKESTILQQISEYTEGKNKELLEVRELIKQAETLGVKSYLDVDPSEREVFLEEGTIK